MNWNDLNNILCRFKNNVYAPTLVNDELKYFQYLLMLSDKTSSGSKTLLRLVLLTHEPVRSSQNRFDVTKHW